MTISAIQIAMLGGLQICQEDKVVSHFPTRKTGALLAYLAYYPHQTHPREKLIDLFWPDLEVTAARHNLRQTLYSLRRLLEPAGQHSSNNVFHADAFSICLQARSLSTDVQTFRATLEAAQRTQSEEKLSLLLEAVRLYRGELLPGWYEEWIHTERENLATAYEQTLQQLSEAWALRENWDQSLFYGRKAVAANPHEETLHLALMRLYIQAGQPGKAKQQYQTLTQMLKEEWNTLPSPAAEALLSALRTTGRSAAPSSSPSSINSSIDSSIEPSVDASANPTEETPFDSSVEALSTVTMEQTISLKSEITLLPVPLTRFFGRETEIAQIGLLLERSQARLLTLIGPAGCGKTRLAVELGRQLTTAFSNRVYFVPFASIINAHSLPDAILRALRLSPQPGKDALDQLAAHLGPQPALLILDNFEHLVEEGSALVTRLAQQLPQIQILITSRRLLGVAGERQYYLLPLQIPHKPISANTALLPLSTVARLLEFPGVAMFVDRAQTANPHFTLNKRNAQAVLDLSERLEGIPLAIELAAARSGMLAPAQMLAQWDESFTLLTTRHRTLNAHDSPYQAIEHSYLQLAPETQQALVEISVFRGGWTFEAACFVSKNVRMREHLESLRAFSLVWTQMTEIQEVRTEETVRFQILESVR